MSEWAVTTSQGLFFVDINVKIFKHRVSGDETIEIDGRMITDVSWIAHNEDTDLLLLNVREPFFYQGEGKGRKS